MTKKEEELIKDYIKEAKALFATRVAGAIRKSLFWQLDLALTNLKGRSKPSKKEEKTK